METYCSLNSHQGQSGLLCMRWCVAMEFAHSKCLYTFSHMQEYATKHDVMHTPHLQEYGVLKKSMIDLETIMLREFGFIVHVDHPHKLVLNHLNLLHQGVQNPLARTRLMQEAFNLTNDRYALLTL